MSMNDTITKEIDDLKSLWTQVLGVTPDDAQFVIWLGMRPATVIRWVILKTAARSRAKREPTSQDYQIRYVSSCLIHYDGRPVKEVALLEGR
jgi:hypothetical protein